MDKYTELARHTIEEYIKNRKIYRPEEDELTEEMREARAGAFVSLHKNGELRGCIGTIEAARNTLAEEIVSNAIAASTRDPRFNAVMPEELAELEINVDVLGQAEPVSSLAELDVKRYGVIVSKGYRRGLLLPDLEGVDTPEYQVAIAMRKAGIAPDESDIELQRFEVIRHE